MKRFAIAYIANRYMDWCPTGTAESVTLIDAETKNKALDYLKEEWFKEDGGWDEMTHVSENQWKIKEVNSTEKITKELVEKVCKQLFPCTSETSFITN